MPADPPGQGSRRPVRIGKYEVVAHIATGGMGAVYRAYDTELRREVALKVLPPETAAKPAMLERFRREARSAAKLRHDNIVSIYEFGEASGTYYLALEFVDGVDLHELINRKGQLDPDLARRILVQASRALDHAHRQGIVHRDVKPSNFLIAQKDGALLVKLTDLGLARENECDEFRVTRDGTTVGTVDYMSPEQARDSAAADIRSDIYSLGCTFYHMLTGNAPFSEGSLTERIYKHVEAEPPDVRRFNPAVTVDLAAILRRMLEKKPEDRYQTPQELLDDLENPGGLVGLPGLAELPANMPAPRPKPPPETEARLRSLTPRSGQEVRKAKPKSKPGSGGESKSAASRKRARDTGEQDKPAKRARKKARGQAATPWWPWAAGGGGLVGVVLLVLLLVLGGNRDDEAANRRQQPPDPPPVKPVAKAKELVKEEPKSKYPVLYRPAGPDEVVRLRQEFEGPPGKLSVVPVDALTFRVRRAASPGPDSFRSLAEACAKAPEGRTTVIEIHDNGPLLEPSLPPVAGRSLVLRPGRGYRPLLAWDVAAGTPGPLLALQQGNLTLDNLDVVVKWSGARLERPAVLFAVSGGDFVARDCTFSVSGKPGAAVQVVHVEGKETPAKCRLSRCYLRGAALTALALEGAGADALLEGCLVVGGGQPLVDVTAADGPVFTVRLVRSTLLADKNLLRAASPAGKDGAPAVKWLAWDSLLAHPGAEAGGDLLRVAGGAGVYKVGWRAVNSAYVGWDKLLAGGDKDIPTKGLDAWRTLWGYKGGDAALARPWPAALPEALEESGPAPYDPTDTPVHFLANDGPGTVGAVLTLLPAGRPSWQALLGGDVTPLPLPEAGEAPAIPAAGDGLYHGGKIVLTKGIDLGQFLDAKAFQMGLGPKVVLDLSGVGEQKTSPISVQGIQLVLLCRHPDPSRPLTLVPNPATCAGKEALIEVKNGNLDLIGARIVFENSPKAVLPARMLKVEGGGLRLLNCSLRGPLAKVPAGYRELIRFEGSGGDELPETGCAVSQCLLLSGKTVLCVAGTGARVRLQQCLVVAADDALRLEPGAEAEKTLNIECSLEHNTIAVRGSVLHVGDAPKVSGAVPPIIVQAEGNLFLDPFSETPRRSALLRFEGDALARGLVLWRGKGNGYDDKRLHTYLAPAGRESEQEGHAAWARAWGKVGEQQAVLVEWPAPGLWTFPTDRPQLDRVRVPPAVRATVGADLVRLGILRKKG